MFAQASVKSPPKLEDGRTERKEGRERGNCTAAGVFDKVQAPPMSVRNKGGRGAAGHSELLKNLHAYH